MQAGLNPESGTSKRYSIKGGQFFILARESVLDIAIVFTLGTCHIDVFGIASATSTNGSNYDCANFSFALDAGMLNSVITPANYCSSIDFDINSQLNWFSVRDGSFQDGSFLNEKWKSIRIVPEDGLVGDDDEWFILSQYERKTKSSPRMVFRRCCVQGHWRQRISSSQLDFAIEESSALSLEAFR